MGPGRPAKPTVNKLVQGTFRTDRFLENEMMPSTIDHPPSAPSVLSALAKKEWNSVCQELISLGMLHRVDLGLLSAYCIEMASYLEESKLIKKEGSVITIQGKMGEYKMQNPRIGIKNTALKNAQALANQFGFTPSARTRINAVPKDDTDPLAALLKAKLNKGHENK
jgi:P27 family predicted phage terminase small subunit